MPVFNRPVWNRMALMTTMKAIKSDGMARMPKLCPQRSNALFELPWILPFQVRCRHDEHPCSDERKSACINRNVLKSLQIKTKATKHVSKSIQMATHCQKINRQNALSWSAISKKLKDSVGLAKIEHIDYKEGS